MPGAVQRPQPGGVTLDTSLPPRYVWHITWDQLRADGTQPDFSAVANYLIDQQYCPNIMWNPFTGYMEQYYPANLGGRALKYNNQDGSACVQVEVFFTPGCVVDGVKYATVADTPLVGWAELLAWGDSLGVPRAWPMGSPQWAGNSRDVGTWNNNAGHYGHCHSPGDSHTDPGPMPALTGGTISVQSATIQAAPHPEEDFMGGTIDAQQAEDIVQSTTDRVVDRLTKELFSKADGAYQNQVLAGLYTKADGAWTNGQVGNLPAQVLNQSFKLPDGTPTNLAGILSAIHAQPATITGGVLDVDSLVARLKAELPAAVLAELTTKLSQ